MIRKLLLPLVAVALLGGCVTSYSYRSGSGDYYYGAPSVEYRYSPSYYYGGPYGYGYGYPYGYYGRSVYDYRYHSPYRYRLYYTDPYRNHYYGYPYRQPNHAHRRPGSRPTVDPTPDGTRSPWRDFDRLRRRDTGGGSDATQPPTIGLPGGDANSSVNTERPRAPRREFERRRVPVDTGGSTQPREIASPQPPSPRYSSPGPRGDSSARGGRMRAAKGDPTAETTP